MSKFTAAEWKKIRTTLNADPARYGIPARVYGSAVVASANVRKLGAKSKRDKHTWQFFADIFRHFDLLAIQEVMEDMEGLRHIIELMGEDFGIVVSDTTGAFPDEGGLAERLAFVFNWTAFKRKELVTDVSYDRSKVLEIIGEHADAIRDAVAEAKEKADYKKKLESYEKKLAKAKKDGKKWPDKPRLPVKMPTFVSFIRTPFAVMFESRGHPGADRYTFIAINAHLYFGTRTEDRRQEFNALMDWVMGRVQEGDVNDSVNILLLGDLNLDFDDPDIDRKRILKKIADLNIEGGDEVNVYFPFLHGHPKRPDQQLMGRDGKALKTNVRMTETYDQIAIFSRSERLKLLKNEDAGKSPRGPDFGVVDFANLFAEALHGKPLNDLGKPTRDKLLKKFQHSVSDHMPLWFRIPLPDVAEGVVVKEP